MLSACIFRLGPEVGMNPDQRIRLELLDHCGTFDDFSFAFGFMLLAGWALPPVVVPNPCAVERFSTLPVGSGSSYSRHPLLP